MQNRSPKHFRPEPLREHMSSTRNQNSINNRVSPVWVTHTPPPYIRSDDGDEDSRSSTSSSDVKENTDKNKNMKDRLVSLITPSWSGIINRRPRESDSETGTSGIQIFPNGTRVSPPMSPLLERRHLKEPLELSSLKSSFGQSPGLQEESLLTSVHPAEYYAAKVAVYQQKYSYLKSWPGLLRLLAGLQVLFGGVVVACVITYVHKDSEWSNAYGLYSGTSSNALGLPAYGYRGPMTPFIIAVAGVSWMLTLCLLVTGMTMYYRTILLDSPWWPLTEAFINLALFLLYMAAGIVYLNDLNRGGLCYMTIGVNPVMASLCRVEGGQMAGTAFLFMNMTLYLGSFLACLKMWRHEAARRERHIQRKKGAFHQSITNTPKKISQKLLKDETDEFLPPGVSITADYIVKYPKISSMEEREKYRDVFNEEYEEYKELHRDILITLKKFRELDIMVEKLPTCGKSTEDQQRIQNILNTYDQKKNDPAFLEKKELCDYLKAKLRHIKNQIHIYDEENYSSNQK